MHTVGFLVEKDGEDLYLMSAVVNADGKVIGKQWNPQMKDYVGAFQLMPWRII